jgi:rRNA maturation RNase YbeY
MTTFHFEDHQPFELESTKFNQKISYLIDNEGFIKKEITIVLCSDSHLLKMNKEHLNHDYFTDIITFSYNTKNQISGDLFISVDRIKDNAERFKVSFDKELERVIYHGVLHLCGYDDKTVDEISVMREKEKYYLECDVSRET